MAITIDLPEDIERDLRSSWSEIGRIAREAIAVEGYREGILSRGQVERLLGVDYWTAQKFLAERNAIPPYGEEEYREDMETLDRLYPPAKREASVS